jgi:hypothetical protein
MKPTGPEAQFPHASMSNRGNLATLLGFVGLVVRGKRKKRWLADVLKQAGERADYIEAFD